MTPDPLIAIHARPDSFSEHWLEYCSAHHLRVRTVDCHDSDILDQLRDVDILLWHWTHFDPTDLLVARPILRAAQFMGLTVYPNAATCWHFDDKLAQKYLLESLRAPLVPTQVFYTRHDALAWIDRATFPKVFKLRRGAASANVRLVRDARQARALVRRAFGDGFNPMGAYLGDAAVRWRRLRRGRNLLQSLLAVPQKLRALWNMNHGLGRERGYVYFQDYLPDNAFDARVTVIGDRAFAFRRMARPNDFRASGSGAIDYRPQAIDPAFLEIAFRVAGAMHAQTAAFDFLYDAAGAANIVEVSYGFASSAVHECPGYWDRSLAWHQGHRWPEHLILADAIKAWALKTNFAAAPAQSPRAAGPAFARSF